MKKYILLVIITIISACECTECPECCECSQDTIIHYSTTGQIVAYMKAREIETLESVFGLLIITSTYDSILSFNIPEFVHKLDSSKLNGMKMIDGGIVDILYRIPDSTEIINYHPVIIPDDLPWIYPVSNFYQVYYIDKNE